MTDDPVAHASANVVQWMSVVALAAEAFVQVTAVRAREANQRDRLGAQQARAERLTMLGRDRLLWEPINDPARRAGMSVQEAGVVWASALPWAPDPEAVRAAGLAEERLRELRPDVMAIYDRQVAQGGDPVMAMHSVVGLMDRVPDSPTLTERVELVVPRSAENVVESACSVRAEPVMVPVEVDRGRLFDAVAAAEWFYSGQLLGSWVPEYLQGRRLAGCLEERSPWVVGYAPDSWTALTEHLRGQGFTDQEMLDAGLVSRSVRGGVVDRFRDRLMISAVNRDGWTAGFVGRANPNVESARVPKYLNSPASAVYDKSEILLGLHEYRTPLVEGATPVLVEGAFDAMAVTEATGGRYVGVAPSGTAVTVEQLQALRPYCRADAVVVAFDGDLEGQRSAARSMGPLVAAGFAAKAAAVGKGQDPAEMWAKGREAGLAEGLVRSRPLADLVVNVRLAEWPAHRREHRVDLLQAARWVAGTIAELPVGEVARQVGRVAERLDVPTSVITAAVTDAMSQPAADVNRAAVVGQVREPAVLSR